MLLVSFTPDSTSYTSATGSVSLTVNKASPSIGLHSSAQSCPRIEQHYAHGDGLFLREYANGAGGLL